jgi:citrate lyase subunit alpha/citrate CoA-transferase
MKNIINRFVPDGYSPFNGTEDYKLYQRTLVEIIESRNKSEKLRYSLKDLFDELQIKDKMTLSFHHHLRNGDSLMNLVFDEIKNRNLKDMTIAASSIFPVNKILSELIINENVTKIYTNYLNGDVAKTISEGKLKGPLIMDTHGGRSRAIESGDIVIDVAFIACPSSDKLGNASGVNGPSSCGALGYAIPDMYYALKKIVVTDYLMDKVDNPEIEAKFIDYCLVVESLGDSSKIVSGTTKITKDPIGLKIARDVVSLLDELGMIVEGFSMQTGAGGIPLAVTKYIKDLMIKKNIKASFASGGIASLNVEMLEEGLIKDLYDVQCFDLEAVRSIKVNPNHHPISAFKYANLYEDTVINNLDFVILGATEIDLDFNVNVTTASNGLIMGGSGGHADTSHSSKVSVIVSPLVKSRNPLIKESLRCVTTPGDDVDILVTERGIAINPRRSDLKELLHNSKLKIVDIRDLYDIALKITGVPLRSDVSNEVIGVVRYRDLKVIDTLYRI